MKRIISIIASLAICLVLTACNNTVQTKTNRFEGLMFVRSPGDILTNLKSFDQLDSACDFVVIGEFIDDASVCYEGYMYNDYFGKEVLTDILSSCPMKVTKVLSGDINVGDVVNVLQREGIWEDRFITDSALTPMQKGDEWVFCLKHSTESDHAEGYWCFGDSYGRYPTKNVRSNEIMCFSDYPELGVYEKSDFHEKFYNGLVEKYGV